MEKSSAREGAEGVVEGVKGKTKQVVGAVTNDRELQREGEAQRDKARSQRNAAGKEAEASKERANAKVSEARQASHQKH